MRVLAHGGAGGAAVEILIMVGVAAVFVAVWLRERKVSREEEGER